MLLNFYKPFTPSYRFKKKISSFLSSQKINKKLKLNFFKKKIYNNHKFLNKNNSCYMLNMNKPLHSISILIKLFKFSYSNCLGGFFETSWGEIFIKKLHYGFSFENFYFNKTHFDFIFFKKKKYNFLQKWIIALFTTNFKFFCLTDSINRNVYANSAGSFCCIKNKERAKKIYFVQLPSKKKMFFDFFSTAHIGRVSNIFYKYTVFSSFNQKFLLKKKKQSTRGVAMNPVDHPNGGRSKVKKPFRNPWGAVAKKNK